MVTMSMNELTSELTEDELRDLEAAEKMPLVHDADSPKLTEEMLMQFKHMNREERIKQTVSLRLSPDTMNKAKALGRGYTSVLSRLLDLAINDTEMLKKCL